MSTSFLDEIGVDDNSFFPSVYSYTMDDKIYGIAVQNVCLMICVDEEVLGGTEVPTFGDYIDKLLNYPNDSIFWNPYQPTEYILRMLLEASESLGGTVDKENKTCNFKSDLFYKLLEVSKRYGDVKDKGYPNIIETVDVGSSGMYPGEKALKDSGWVIVNGFFDDGNYPVFGTGLTLFANSGSNCIEGVKAFISYALSGYGQSLIADPVNKRIYDSFMADRMTMNIVGGEYDLTEEIISESRHMCEIGRYSPKDNEEILDIIIEESIPYFEGSKTKEEVAEVIQSRVQLMLSE